MASDSNKISFLEDYVLSENRLDTTYAQFNEDTEEYWQYSLLYILNKSDDGKDAQTQAFLKKLEKSSFKDSQIIQNLIFRQQLKSFDSSGRKELVQRIRKIVGVTGASDDSKSNAEEKKQSGGKSKSIRDCVGTKVVKKGGVEVDVKAAIALFLKQAKEQYLNLADLFSPTAVDQIVSNQSDLDKLTKDEVAGILKLLKDAPPTATMLLQLIARDLKENEVEFGKREIHNKLTVDQLKKLGDQDSSLYKTLSFVQVMAAKLRPISDVDYRNNEAYCRAYLDKLRAFAKEKLKHATFKAVILFNYLLFYESLAQGNENADLVAYQKAVYGNSAPKAAKKEKKKKKSDALSNLGPPVPSNLKYPTYDKDALVAYLSLPRRGAAFSANNASEKASKNAATCVDTSFCAEKLFPELVAIGDDTAFVERALGFFFLKGELTGGWPMVKKEWALIRFAKEKLMANAGNDKFLKAQEGAIREGCSSKYFNTFVKESQLRILETNRKFYGVDEAVTLEYFTKNNPTIRFNIYEVNAKNYYNEYNSEIPIDIPLSGAVPMKSIVRKYKEKSLIRRADAITIKSLKGKRGIFVIDIVGNNISARAFIRKGELRFIYEQTNGGYDFYVFDENYKPIGSPRIYMEGVCYNVCKDEEKKEKEGKITLPFADDCDRDVQTIIIEDSKSGSSAVLRSFKRQKKSYELRGGFYIDRENLLAKQQAKLLIRSNLYLCQEQTTLSMAANSYVTLEFKTLDSNTTTNVYEIDLSDNVDNEIEFTVPASLRELSCKLSVNCCCIDLSISHSFKVNGIDACPFIADVFIIPDAKKGYFLNTVGKNGESFADEVLEIRLFHRFFSRPVSCTVVTDKNGLALLGKLENVTSITVNPKNSSFFSEKTFNLLQDLVNVPSRICRKEKTVIRIPFSSALENANPRICVYDSQFSSDISKAAEYKDGYVIMSSLPPGDYSVFIEDVLNARVTLHVSSGSSFTCHLGDYVLSNSRILQLSEDTPLQIVNVKSGGDSGDMEIQLNGSNAQTRVHVIVNSLLPVFTPYQSLCAPVRYPDVIDFVTLSNSQYTKTSKCDEEYMYILERNKAKAVSYTGNNLPTPSLIFGRYAANPTARECPKEPEPEQAKRVQAIFKSRYDNVLQESFAFDLLRSDDTSNVEFLPQGSLVFSNLKADDKGLVKVPAFKKSNFRVVQIIATDDDNTALLNYVLANGAPIGPDMGTSDVRLNPGFDPKAHHSPCRKIVCLNGGESYTVKDFSAADYVPFDKLSGLFDLYCGLSGETNACVSSTLSKFRPLVQWSSLSATEKLKFYDDFMCNEVNFFLYRRDREFFDETVKPVIKCKIYKSFMDSYLLDSSLDRWLDPYLFSLLNTFEQILLASRNMKEAVCAATIRSIEENAALIPRNPKGDDQIFDAAKYRNRVDLLGKNAVNAGAGGGAEEEKDNSDEKEAVYDPFSTDETICVEERMYYNVAGDQRTCGLVGPTKFWKDYALFVLQDGSKGSFLSPWVGHAANNLNEMLLALAVIDLPLVADEPDIGRPRGSALSSTEATLTPKQPCVLFLEELVESQLVSSTLSVHSNYFDPRDSSEIVHGEKVDKFVVGQFETRKIYGCRSVITNVSSVEQEIEVLLQIPAGSIAVNQSYRTKSYKQKLSPFKTERLTYYFYFPTPGEFACFPVHINKNGRTIAFALDERLSKMEVFGFGDEKVQNKKSSANKESWEFITSPENGNAKDILNFLSSSARAYEVDLGKLGARLKKDPKFFDNVTKVLKERGIYDEKVWAYSLVSDKGGAEICEYLSQQKHFLEYIHPYFDSDNFKYDPFDRFDWCLTEFSPLISSRSHCDNAIQYSMSERFIDEYGKFLLLIAFRSFNLESISIIDKLILVQYLIYQERITEAKSLFTSVDSKAGSAASALIYDYLSCFLEIYDGNVQDSVTKVMSWKAKPLPPSVSSLWQSLENIATEVEKPGCVDAVFDADFIQDKSDESTPYIDFAFVNHKEKRFIDVSYRNLDKCSVNYYNVDLELLFSQSPFNNDSASISRLISTIYPNDQKKLDLPKESAEKPYKKYVSEDTNANNKHTYFDLPIECRAKNTIIEIVGNDNCSRSAKSLNDNTLLVQFDKGGKLGQVRVVHGNAKDKENYKKPIAGSYVKVYSLNSDGSSQFFKDGYTDIRGRFNYRTLSTNQLANAAGLSMFVQTPDNGSAVIAVPI